MPSGERFRVTVREIKYDLSAEQYQILTKKIFTLPKRPKWGDRQRINGLAKKHLFRLKDGRYVRTNLGNEILKEFKAKIKTK